MKTRATGVAGVLVGLALTGLAWAPGCGAAPGGRAVDVNGAYAYSAGTLRAVVGDSLPRTTAATQASTEQAQFIMDPPEEGDGWVRLTGEMPNGKNVWIRLTARNSGLTEVKIRTGLLGNEGVSRIVLDRIRYNLAVAP